MTEQRNLILAIVLSVGIILAFQYFYEVPRMREAQKAAQQQATEQPMGELPQPQAPPMPALSQAELGEMLLETALKQVPRVAIDNGRLHGSVSLEGARFDDLTLADYRVSLAADAPEIRLLRPYGTREAYFAEFGWVAADPSTKVPDRSTRWQALGAGIGHGAPLVLEWDNGDGLIFRQKISLDSDYMFTVEREVVNRGSTAVTLHPWALVSRWTTPHTLGYFILHEGPIGVLDGVLREIDYSDLQDDGRVAFSTTGGWLGFTDKYWLVALIPDPARRIDVTFRHTAPDGHDRYQADFISEPLTVAPGASVTLVDRLFAGAKEVELLDRYQAELGIPLFDRAVDFGWFYFLTKPIFKLLHWLYKWTGNYGVAILILTLLIRIALFPLANKSYVAMSRMKQLQPEMMKIRERFEHDKARMNQELMELYRREKVNPMAGCLPIIIQIPVFFALYKVLFVSIEMRHAPFFGWIQDLSAPDPSNLFNLFGLIPWQPPAFLHLGALPILMGFTMWLQQKLNPQPADPVQARVLMLLPIMFTFLFASFPAGLVLYWTWSNILSIAQQWLIMYRMGVAGSKLS
jgi:YidC/Oxa1 family membrane protein insertase